MRRREGTSLDFAAKLDPTPTAFRNGFAEGDFLVFLSVIW